MYRYTTLIIKYSCMLYMTLHYLVNLSRSINITLYMQIPLNSEWMAFDKELLFSVISRARMEGCCLRVPMRIRLTILLHYFRW